MTLGRQRGSIVNGDGRAPDPTLRAVSDAVLAVAAELSVEDVLQRLVDSSRELAGARYAALGCPTARAASARFLTSGMSDELIASLGPLPRQHGMLGAMLDTHDARTARATSTTIRGSAAGGRERTRTCGRSSASRSSRRRG